MKSLWVGKGERGYRMIRIYLKKYIDIYHTYLYYNTYRYIGNTISVLCTIWHQTAIHKFRTKNSTYTSCIPIEDTTNDDILSSFTATCMHTKTEIRQNLSSIIGIIYI